MQPYWKTLGLDAPPDDLKTVKRAYAAKLKVTRPDDDPQGFMELRDAFEIAKHNMRFLASQAEAEITPITPEADTGTDTETEYSEFLPDTPLPSQTPETEPLEIIYNEDTAVSDIADTVPLKQPPLYSDIQTLLNDRVGRNHKNNWRELFAKARECSIDEFIDFDRHLRETLLETFGYYDGDIKKHNWKRNTPFISSLVATFIFKEMEWTKLEGRDYAVQQELDWLRRDMDVISKQGSPAMTAHSTTSYETENTGPNVWGIVLGVFVLIQVLRLIVDFAA